MAQRVPVSVVCVFNDPVVRERCLDASIDALRHEAPETEYIPVDNVSHAFPTAGAALNHGAGIARNPVVVLVHQDVYLHSLVALEEAAALLAGESRIGMLGAFGVTPEGGLAGRVRDRIVLLGDRPAEPVDVDSLDEVLFMVSREQLMSEPLSEAPELAWHAYAVEYGVRLRALGLRVAAADLPLTHNSMSINLAKLDVAHRAVAALHPDHLPVRTTCGVVSTAAEPASPPFLADHRWRYRWLRGSIAAHQARRAAGTTGRFVLSDLRMDIDDVIEVSPAPFHVVNLNPDAGFRDAPGPFELHRGDRPVLFSSGTTAELLEAVRRHDRSGALLLTNLDGATLRALRPLLGEQPGISGLHPDYGSWTLLRPEPAGTPDQWQARSAVPLGMSPTAG